MGNILEDERLQNIKQEEKEALEELENLYGGQISSSKELYEAVKDATETLSKEQTQQLREQTQLAVEELQQRKEEAKQDYLQEQAAAYADYRSQSRTHGVREEALAETGLGNTGYAETSRVAMYNQYQNRVAAARAGYTAAMTNYDLGIRQAQAQNSALLAQIALNTLETQLKYALETFRFESQQELAHYQQKGQLQKDYLERYEQQLAQVRREQAGLSATLPEEEEEGPKTLYDLLDEAKARRQEQINNNSIVKAMRDTVLKVEETDSILATMDWLKNKDQGGS